MPLSLFWNFKTSKLPDLLFILNHNILFVFVALSHQKSPTGLRGCGRAKEEAARLSSKLHCSQLKGSSEIFCFFLHTRKEGWWKCTWNSVVRRNHGTNSASFCETIAHTSWWCFIFI